MSGYAQLFSRAYAVTLSDPKSTTGTRFGNMDAAGTALRCGFEIKKDALGAPNTGKITLYNLEPALRSAITIGWRVTLSAGYAGFVDQLFTGDVSAVVTTRSGPDITTEMTAQDGGRSLLNASFNQKYPKGTPLSSILKDVTKAMGVKPGIVLGLPDYRLGRSQTLCGGCAHVLHVCLDRHGIQFSVQNGKLNMYPKGKHLGTQAVVVSAATGMINIPSITNEALKFESLLNPMLVPGQLLQLRSSTAASIKYYTVRSASFEGDTHDAAWKVAVEAAPVTQPVQVLTPAHGLDYGAAVVAGTS